jgi:hypothetical protein
VEKYSGGANKNKGEQMSSQISDLINPMRLRLGIKRAFTGDIHEILGENFKILCGQEPEMCRSQLMI